MGYYSIISRQPEYTFLWSHLGVKCIVHEKVKFETEISSFDLEFCKIYQHIQNKKNVQTVFFRLKIIMINTGNSLE